MKQGQRTVDGVAFISVEEAARRLGMEEERVEGLVDAGRLRHHRDGAMRVWIEEEGVRRMVSGARKRQVRRTAADMGGGSAGSHAAESGRRFVFLGTELIAAREASDRLGVCLEWIHILVRSGRLNGVKDRGRWWLFPDEVESYGRRQAAWRAAGGKWTSFGRSERIQGRRTELREMRPDGSEAVNAGSLEVGRGHVPREMLSEDALRAARELPADGTASQPLHQDRWITAKEAAAILQVRYGEIHCLARRGRLERRMCPFPDREHVRRGLSPHRVRAWFRLEEVLREQDRRESAAYGRCATPRELEAGSTLRPVIRRTIEAPAGDRLISVREAAAILNVTRGRVGDLVHAGRLFGWQSQPGKRGCRLWLSERQVWRYANDPVRARRHSAQPGKAPVVEGSRRSDEEEEGWPGVWVRGVEAGGEPRRSTREEWMERYGLQDLPRDEPGRHEEKDWGEYLTSRQAARLLGITAPSLRTLRLRGRLPGHQKPRRKPDGAGRKWWFYRKEDVDRLLGDAEYLRRHALAKRTRS